MGSISILLAIFALLERIIFKPGAQRAMLRRLRQIAPTAVMLRVAVMLRNCG